MTGLPRPEEFPIGSPESRAAARLQLGRMMDTCKRVTVIFDCPRPKTENLRVIIGKWHGSPKGTFTRTVFVPHFALKPGEPTPVCPDCGTPFKKTCEYPGSVGFMADCLEKHDPELPSAFLVSCEANQAMALSLA
jgi:hypothetical protein